MPEYKVTLNDPGNSVDPSRSWKRYHSDVPLEYGNEIVIEEDQAEPGKGPSSLRVRVTSVDNDAFFTSGVTVEPIGETSRPEL